MSRPAALMVAALFGGVLLTSGAYANHDVTDTLGSPMRGNAGRTVTIDASTKFVRVEHLGTVTIRNQRGQSFSWKFETFYVPTGFPLVRIAPSDFDAGETWVYVYPSPAFPSD